MGARRGHFGKSLVVATIPPTVTSAMHVSGYYFFFKKKTLNTSVAGRRERKWLWVWRSLSFKGQQLRLQNITLTLHIKINPDLLLSLLLSSWLQNLKVNWLDHGKPRICLNPKHRPWDQRKSRPRRGKRQRRRLSARQSKKEYRLEEEEEAW